MKQLKQRSMILLVALTLGCGDSNNRKSYGESVPLTDAVPADEIAEDASPITDLNADDSSQPEDDLGGMEETRTDPLDTSQDAPQVDSQDPPPLAPSTEAIALHYAPIWYQDTANGGPDNVGAKADVPTTADYDGDLQHNNNWDSLPGKKIRPSLYYGITVSETHYFLTYSQYHPRDWEAICLGLTGACHEGDMESVWIVAKRAEPGFGQVMFVRAHHHGQTTTWSNDSKIGEKVTLLSGIDFEDLKGSIAAKQSDSQSHVRIFSEAHGHGTSPCTAQELLIKPFGILNVSCPDSSGRTFPGGDGIKFVPTLEEPAFYKAGTENSDTAIEYGLVPISETLWQWRAQIGPKQMFRDKDPFIYLGAQGAPFVSAGPIGSHFDVDQFTNDDLTGSAPWSRTLDGSEQGDVFLDPAWAYKKWLNINQDWSLKYTYHPYLDVVETP